MFGNSINGLKVKQKPKPLDSHYIFLVTEVVPHDGRDLYITFTVRLHRKFVKFVRLKRGRYKVLLRPDAYEEIANKLQLRKKPVGEVMIYPKFAA